jgi:hypothetical protein
VRWVAFAQTCPEIASLAQDRFARDELVLVGTLRADGSPRVSPVEPDFAAGELFLGMMWRSRKALDLMRDPRCVVHSVPLTRFNPGGDIKLYGRAVEITDQAVRQTYRDTIFARIEWAPEEPQFHVFALDVEAGGYTVFGEDSHALSWTAEQGLRRLKVP